METMQEEADTDSGPDILSSAEYANLESEGIALLTRQLQVNIPSSDWKLSYEEKPQHRYNMTTLQAQTSADFLNNDNENYSGDVNNENQAEAGTEVSRTIRFVVKL